MKLIVKIVMALVCSLAISVGIGEARTIVNQQRGYSIWIPDYFVERDHFGIQDFRADGGDDFGAKNCLNGGEGIEVTISTEACDIEEADETYVEKRISELKKIDQLWFPNHVYKYAPCVVKPHHLGIMTFRLPKDGVGSFEIEIIAHGKKINVWVSGIAQSQETLKKIVNTAGGILDSFVCLKH